MNLEDERKNVEELESELRQLEEQIELKTLRIKTGRNSIAKQMCPFIEGETVVSPRGEKQIIANIYATPWGELTYLFKVFKITKGGEPFKKECCGGYRVDLYKKYEGEGTL